LQAFFEKIKQKFNLEIGNFYSKSTHYYFIKTYINMKFYEFYFYFCSCVVVHTGYSWEAILNALTVSSLIQVSIKLLCSLFVIKLNIYFQFFILILFVPFFVFFESFYTFRTFLARFFKAFVPQSCYEDLDPDRDDDYYETPEDENNKWYNYMLLSIIHFFIAFRLFILQQPWLSIILKFIAVRYFILNEYLFLAYLISFVFIFSRFVFLLSDETLSNWKATFRESLLEDKEGIPRVTKENIKIMTHWSLRYVCMWQLYQIMKKEDKNNVTDLNMNMYDKMKDKFNLENEPVITNAKNKKFIFSIFFLCILYILANYFHDYF